MNAVPPWFARDWSRWLIRVEWAERTEQARGWERRTKVREYWTYVGVESGLLAVRQGTWRDVLSAGEQVVLQPDLPFNVRAEGAPVVLCMLDFRMVPSSHGVAPLPRLGLPAKVAVARRVPWQGICRRLFGEGGARSRETAHDSVEVRPWADLLLSRYLADGFAAGAFAASASDMVPEWLARVRDRMHQPAALHDLTVASLVRLSGFSRSHLGHEFRRRFGLSPRQYLWELRLTVAARQLSTRRTLSIEHIARDCGFSSRSRLAQMFQNRFGMTPRQWRQGRPGVGAQPPRNP